MSDLDFLHTADLTSDQNKSDLFRNKDCSVRMYMSPVPELPDIRDPLKQLPAESVLSELLLSGSAVPALSKLLLSVPPVPALSELLLSAPPVPAPSLFLLLEPGLSLTYQTAALRNTDKTLRRQEFLDNT